MKIEIIQGSFFEARQYCEKKSKEAVFSELSYMDSFDKAVTEFNKFLCEINLSDVVGEKTEKTVVVNLSPWNEDWAYNTYLESFLYMLSDMKDGLSFMFIFEKEMNKRLLEKIKGLELFDLILTVLPHMEKNKDAVRIGFFDSCKPEGDERNV